jgi:hypothetical protein
MTLEQLLLRRREVHRELMLGFERRMMADAPDIALELGIDPAAFARALQPHVDDFVDQSLARLNGHCSDAGTMD